MKRRFTTNLDLLPCDKGAIVDLCKTIDETPQIGARIRLDTFTKVVLYVVGVCYEKDEVVVELSHSPSTSLRAFYEYDYCHRTGRSLHAFI